MWMPRLSIFDRWCRWMSTPCALRSRKPAAVSLRTRPRAFRGSARRFCRSFRGVLLGLGGADTARCRVGHAVSSCIRVGVLSRPGAHQGGTQGCTGTCMSQFTFKMPDLGEGTVEAEIVAWHTKPGDVVTEDQVIVEVMTDKAAVEVPAPVSGRVVSITGAPGDKVAVGSPLIVFELADGAAAAVPAAASPQAATAAAPAAATVTV